MTDEFTLIEDGLPPAYKDVLALTADGVFERAYRIESIWIAPLDGGMIRNVVAWKIVTIPEQFRREE